jgi:hypothetical protein
MFTLMKLASPSVSQLPKRHFLTTLSNTRRRSSPRCGNLQHASLQLPQFNRMFSHLSPL